MTSPVVGFAGMTHLGLNSAVAAAERGFQIVGYDASEALAAALDRGELPVREPDLPEMLARNRQRIRFTADTAALGGCDVVYVAPDISTDDSGTSDLAPIRALLTEVDAAMAPDAVLVILSQVPPGFTRGLGTTRRHLYYQVETLIFGRAVDRALNPERYIIGCADPTQPLPPAFATFLKAYGCPLLPMRYESAELAKISINCCLVASVSVANTLAELCEAIGADWSEIVPALRLDKRIGPFSYIVPGLGIAGGNLERDLATVCQFADRYGTDAGVIRAFAANSAHRKDWVLGVLYREVLSQLADPVIAVLGLAYKEDTHSIKNSPSLALLRHLHPFAVRAYDPAVAADPAFHPGLSGAADPIAACKGADVLTIMTPWKQFKELSPAAIAAVMRGRTVIDPFCVLDPLACAAAGLRQLRLGRPAA